MRTNDPRMPEIIANFPSNFSYYIVPLVIALNMNKDFPKGNVSI